jgi:hypothetical protein
MQILCRYKERAAMDSHEQALVLQVLETLEATFEVNIPPGYNEELRFMAHLWEPIRVVHKPLFVHVVLEASLIFSHIFLTALGFRRYHVCGFNYWAHGLKAPLDSQSPPVADHSARLLSALRRVATLAASGLHVLADAASGYDLVDMLSPASPCPNGLPWPVSAQKDAGPEASVDFAVLLGMRVPSAGEAADVYSFALRDAKPSPRPFPSPCPHQKRPLRAPLASRPAPLHPSPKIKGSFQATPPENTPVTFLHGVGLGMLPYLAFLRALMQAFQGHPVLVIEVRHVSLRLCGSARAVDDVVCAVASMLRRHGVQRSHFAAHSFGTFVLAHLRHLYPDVVASMLLCDPVRSCESPSASPSMQ